HARAGRSDGGRGARCAAVGTAARRLAEEVHTTIPCPSRAAHVGCTHIHDCIVREARGPPRRAGDCIVIACSRTAIASRHAGLAHPRHGQPSDAGRPAARALRALRPDGRGPGGHYVDEGAAGDAQPGVLHAHAGPAVQRAGPPPPVRLRERGAGGAGARLRGGRRGGLEEPVPGPLAAEAV
ncbi:hypothetical protein KEM52_001296, partial [Ascosphaera acerosa]